MFSKTLYERRLKTKVLGRELTYLKETSSTNDYLLKNGRFSGSAVVADFQTSGKGRSGRAWFTGEGALAFSILLTDIPVKKLMPLNILAGFSVCDALREYAPVFIKWPNDCVVNGKKICGMLLDAEFAGIRLIKAVLGIGVNIDCRIPPELKLKAASLKNTAHEGFISRETVMADILNNLEKYIESGEDIEKLWPDYSANIGEKISFRRGNEVKIYTEKGIDGNGSLKALDDKGRELLITCGEIGYDFGG